MENHLIIGLGGTGGRVLAAFRKLVYERFGTLKPEGMWVDYLYVDSSSSDLKMDDPKQWDIMGQSVKLENDSVVEIKAADLATYINNRSRFKYLAPWLGEPQDWQNIINDPKISDGAAGQKRRLGRLLFANGSPDFNKRVNAKISALRQNPQGQKVTIHLVCGLAGGTGSGSIIDAVAQLRNEYPDPSNAQIMLYLLLPDEIPNKEWASTDNYQPNGYAALTELNALDLQEFKPWNIGERRYNVERLNLSLPFYSAYLITEQNSENVSFDVQKVVPSSIAEFLFQKTFAVETAKMIGTQSESPREFFHSAERGENPDYTQYDGKHCFKFMTYGIKRLAIPEQEIKEYYGYSFSDQCMLALLYNNFAVEQGFIGEPKKDIEYAGFVTKPETRQKWCITREQLCLSMPVLDEQKKENWKSIKDEYQIVDNFQTNILSDDNIPFNDKLIAIENRTKMFYKKKFRPLREEGQNGVENFYDSKRKHAITPMVEYISGLIEKDLFTQWKTGTSLKDVEGLLAALIESLEAELSTLVQLESDAQTEIKNLSNASTVLLKEWSNTGFFSKIGHKTGLGNNVDSKVTEFSNIIKKKYSLMTWCQGYNFASELIKNLVTALDAIEYNISQAILNLVGVEKTLHDETESRCKDESEEVQSYTSMVVKHYNAMKARSLCSKANAVSSINEKHVRQMRSALLGLLNTEKNSFKDLKEKLTISNVIECASKLGSSMATEFFVNNDDASKIVGYEQLIGINIMEKLQQEFDGNPTGLRRLFEKLVKQAAVMAKHNPSEVNDGPGIKEHTFVIIPEYKGNEDFQKQVEYAIKEASKGTNLKVSIGGAYNEIVIINLESNITPRYLAGVDILRKSQQRLFASGKGQVARFETQLENYGDLPDLYKEDDAAKAKREQAEREQAQAEALPVLMMAKGMGILVSQEDIDTGRNRLTYIPEDEDGLPDLDNAIFLSSSVEKSLAKITPEQTKLLSTEVSRQLISVYKHIDRQAELRKNIASDVKQVMAAHNNNINDPIVIRFNKAFKEIKAKIESINED